jgi:chemotaxis response regulator CheB
VARCDYGIFALVSTALGFDGDGVEALCEIRAVGGTTIAQRLDTAKQPDMPESAIASGCIDFIVSPEDIGRQILAILQREAGGADAVG